VTYARTLTDLAKKGGSGGVPPASQLDVVGKPLPSSLAYQYAVYRTVIPLPLGPVTAIGWPC